MASPDAAFTDGTGAGSTALMVLRACWLTPLALLAGCGAPPPTTDEIRRAYSEHVEADRVHERGLQAKEAPVVIPQQEANCSRDGRTHFDCRIRVIFETAAGARSQEQNVHIRREADAWIIDSVN
jgi:hypothetical protein